MTIRDFLATDQAKNGLLKTDFATCRGDDSVHYVLKRMQEGGREWMGVIDDTYLTAGVRRDQLLDAIAAKKPDERFEVENSPVEPYSYPLTVVAHLDDDAAKVGRRLLDSQQPDLVALDESDKPVAVLPASVLAGYPPLREIA